MKGQPRRDWKAARAKVEEEGECRVCGITRGLQAAHTVGRKYDRPRAEGLKTLWVDPDSIVPLCPSCHGEFDAHETGILEHLTLVEQIYAVAVTGSIESARRRLDPLDYSRPVQDARADVHYENDH